MLRWLFTLAMVVSTTAPWADAGEFRRIGEFSPMSRTANVYLDDWNGDGDLELIHADRVSQALSMASHNLYLAQIYEALDDQWTVKGAYVFRWDSNRSEGDDESDRKDEIYPISPWAKDIPESEVIRELPGDFNSDGIPDTLVAEITARASLEGSPGQSCMLRLKQGDKTLFEELLFDVDSASPRIQTVQPVDFDKDGALEVLVWLSTGGWGAPYAYLYGTPNSRWAAPVPLREPVYLDEALTYLEGVRAAVPERPAPVSAMVSAVSATKHPSDDIGSEVTTYRFRVEFSAVEGGGVTDLASWRDYFMKWGIGYVQGNGKTLVEQVREMRMSPSGDNSLEFETEYPLDLGWIHPGEYELWMECPYVERAPNPFGWFGTLITPRIDVEIDNAWPKVETE